MDTPAEMIAKYRLGGLILVGFSADDPTGTNQPTTNVDNVRQVRGLTDGLRKAAGRAQGRRTAAARRHRPGVRHGHPDQGGRHRAARRDGDRRRRQPEGHRGRLARRRQRARRARRQRRLRPRRRRGRHLRRGDRLPLVRRRPDARRRAGRGVRARAAGRRASRRRSSTSPGTAARPRTRTPSCRCSSRPARRLDEVDLRPFAAGIDAGAWLVMSGHLDVRSVDPGVSATFSHKALTGVLRGELGFQGVVVSDAMNMAPAMKWPAGEAAVRALDAGNDLLLMPPNVGGAYDGLLAAAARRRPAAGPARRGRDPRADPAVPPRRHAAAAPCSGSAPPPIAGPPTASPRPPSPSCAAGARAAVRGPVDRHRLRWPGDLRARCSNGRSRASACAPGPSGGTGRAPRRVRRRRGGPAATAPR